MMIGSTVERWHAWVESKRTVGLEGLLAEDAVFHSPVVHTPQRGRELTRMYLLGAAQVFAESDFRYVREVIGERDAVLEFVATVDGIVINGVDMIRWNERGEIVDFKVMIRPLKAVNLLHAKMGALLAGMRAGE